MKHNGTVFVALFYGFWRCFVLLNLVNEMTSRVRPCISDRRQIIGRPLGFSSQ